MSTTSSAASQLALVVPAVLNVPHLWCESVDRRFFVLHDGVLTYYSHDGDDAVAKGSPIRVSAYTVGTASAPTMDIVLTRRPGVVSTDGVRWVTACTASIKHDCC